MLRSESGGLPVCICQPFALEVDQPIASVAEPRQHIAMILVWRGAGVFGRP